MNIGVISRLPFSLMMSLRAVPLLGGGQVLLGEQDELVLLVLVVVVLAALLGQLHTPCRRRNRPKM